MFTIDEARKVIKQEQLRGISDDEIVNQLVAAGVESRRSKGQPLSKASIGMIVRYDSTSGPATPTKRKRRPKREPFAPSEIKAFTKILLSLDCVLPELAMEMIKEVNQ